MNINQCSSLKADQKAMRTGPLDVSWWNTVKPKGFATRICLSFLQFWVYKEMNGAQYPEAVEVVSMCPWPKSWHFRITVNNVGPINLWDIADPVGPFIAEYLFGDKMDSSCYPLLCIGDVHFKSYSWHFFSNTIVWNVLMLMTFPMLYANNSDCVWYGENKDWT